MPHEEEIVDVDMCGSVEPMMWPYNGDENWCCILGFKWTNDE